MTPEPHVIAPTAADREEAHEIRLAAEAHERERDCPRDEDREAEGNR